MESLSEHLMGADLAVFVAIAALGLGALVAGMAYGAAGQARRAAAEARQASETLAQSHREAERLLDLIREQVRALREEVANLRQATRSAIDAGFDPAGGEQPLEVTERTGRPASAPPRRDDDRTLDISEAGALVGGPIAPPPPPDADTVAPPAPAPIPQAILDADPGDATVMVTKADLPPVPADTVHGHPVLRVVNGPDTGQEFTLPFERATIGRAPGNRVVLHEDKASRTHAEVRFDGRRMVLHDAGSTNGTMYNGTPVTDATLEFDDRITIGATELVFTCEGFEFERARDSDQAILAYQKLLEGRPDFVAALKKLAFLLDRDVTRRDEAAAVWARLNAIKA